jgi:hypothetical protein
LASAFGLLSGVSCCRLFGLRPQRSDLSARRGRVQGCRAGCGKGSGLLGRGLVRGGGGLPLPLRALFAELGSGSGGGCFSRVGSLGLRGAFNGLRFRIGPHPRQLGTRCFRCGGLLGFQSLRVLFGGGGGGSGGGGCCCCFRAQL